jgi:hypothetical protein
VFREHLHGTNLLPWIDGRLSVDRDSPIPSIRIELLVTLILTVQPPHYGRLDHLAITVLVPRIGDGKVRRGLLPERNRGLTVALLLAGMRRGQSSSVPISSIRQ